MKRAITLVIVALLILAGTWMIIKRQKKLPRPSTPLNVLLITIDTIRPDRLSCYGGQNPTPNLDRLASEGMLFENAFSQVPLTFPSHTSILTGMFPVHHGMHQNGTHI